MKRPKDSTLCAIEPLKDAIFGKLVTAFTALRPIDIGGLWFRILTYVLGRVVRRQCSKIRRPLRLYICRKYNWT